MLNWLVHDRGIEPHIPVFDKSQRTDGTLPRDDFTYDHTTDTYRCLVGKTLQHYRRRFAMPRTGIMKDNSMRYRASKRDCQACPLKPRCCPRAPARKISRSIYEGARDLARETAKTEAYQTSRHQRKKVEMLIRTPQAHSEARPDYAVPMGLAMNSTSPPPPRTFGSSLRWFRQPRRYRLEGATPLINSARSSQPAPPG